jgi:hypothetical protein
VPGDPGDRWWYGLLSPAIRTSVGDHLRMTSSPKLDVAGSNPVSRSDTPLIVAVRRNQRSHQSGSVIPEDPSSFWALVWRGCMRRRVRSGLLRRCIG